MKAVKILVILDLIPKQFVVDVIHLVKLVKNLVKKITKKKKNKIRR
jgi:hypothetical protein